MKQWAQEHAKAITAFLSTLVLIIAERVADPDKGTIPAVDDWHGWLVLIGASLFAAVLVYAKKNLLSEQQITEGLAKLDPSAQIRVTTTDHGR